MPPVSAADASAPAEASLAYGGSMAGDVDIASVAAVLADRGRARVLLALGDGRALPATVLAGEAGVAASTASAHLARLRDAGLLRVERHGRHRYFRLAGPEVARLLEALARHAPPAPVRSLRDATRAEALRAARTCYDHLAGRLGVDLMVALLDRGALEGGDGQFHPGAARADHLAGPGRDLDYHLTETGAHLLEELGASVTGNGRRPLVRYCVDWSEQRHHLAGAVGAAIARRLFDLGWLRRADLGRAVHITPAGAAGLRQTFGVVAGAPRS
jgi:DNA-binding transcriptional ArsR family regulator